MRHFYHIIDAATWQEAQAAGSYSAPSLAAEGFIHCSYPEQIVKVANRRFVGSTNLLLLELDPERIAAPVQHDPVTEQHDGETIHDSFPHIYGPLNTNAVVGIIPFPPNADGRFTLPAELEGK